MTLRMIRLELARDGAHPEGDADHGYELRAPLDASGRLDVEGWRAHRKDCTVRQFRPGQDDEHGQLIHTRRGWAISYRPGDDDDEPIYRLGEHLMKPGEYLSVTEDDGVQRTFRVAYVR
jgi:hypothetical protein